MSTRVDNPFRITKSNDLTDAQIDQLWVSLGTNDEIATMARPTAPTAMYVLGGKGSGKSHLMRYYSFPVQQIRYFRDKFTIGQGLENDEYIGIYARCGGMDANRFEGGTISEEKWSKLFAYYFELWVADKTLSAFSTLVTSGDIDAATEATICAGIENLVDVPDISFASIQAVRDFFSDIRRNIDYAVNNAAFTNSIDADVLITPGRLFFGLPKLLVENVSVLRSSVVVYLLDEFENFTANRQIHVNTLLREREGPCSFKIGSRLYGRKTTMTNSGGEQNRKESEYEDLFLDEKFRKHDDAYKDFVVRLISKRLEPSMAARPATDISKFLQGSFENPDLSWNSLYYRQIVPIDGPSIHLQNLHAKIVRGMSEGMVVGPRTAADVQEIVEKLSVPGFPILEKLATLYIFQRWFRGEDIRESAEYIRGRCLAKVSGEKHEKFDEFVSKHSGDMVAQWFRENHQKQLYTGIDNFIRMSEGLPRTLITILKHVYDWASYTGERPFLDGRISARSQQRGVTEAADLFLEQMLPDGEDAQAIGAAVERICALFRANRFADKPVETSLLAFSANAYALTPETRRKLNLAVNSSLLILLPQGQKGKNDHGVTNKYEVNAMLSPRRDLPIARRGIYAFNEAEVELLFDEAAGERFESYSKIWTQRMTAPSFGRRAASFPTNTKQGDFFE